MIVSGLRPLPGLRSALFQRLDGIAIGRQRAYFFIVFQPPQVWVAAERISFKLVSVLDVGKQVLFRLGEFRHETTSFLFRHSSRPYAGGLILHFTRSYHRSFGSPTNSYRCQSRNHGLCAFISSCLRFAAEMSLALSGLMSGASNISCSSRCRQWVQRPFRLINIGTATVKRHGLAA